MKGWRCAAALLCATVAAVASTASSASAVTCRTDGYGYAGVVSDETVGGVAATLTALRDPRVEGGHVAAWIGVGGYGHGPGGSDEWLQAGIAAWPDGGLRVYYEVKTPRRSARAVKVGKALRPGQRVRIAVLEVPLRPGRWQVVINGEPVGPIVSLPSSHGRFAAVATAESWDGGASACNRYRFGFSALAVAASGEWTALQGGLELRDRGHRLVRNAAGFVASAG